MWMDAGFERTSGIACAHHPGRLGADHHGPGTDHGTGADLHARAHKGLGTDPDIGADTYRFCVEREGGKVVIVAAGAKVGALGHNNPFTQNHRRHRVADHARAEAGLGGHLQVPWGPDASIAVDVAAGSNAGTEAAQQPAAPGVQLRWRGAKQQQPDHLPGEAG